MEKHRRTAGLYFALQALAGAAWWISIALSSEVREIFPLENVSRVILADVVLFVGGSAWAAWLILAGREPKRGLEAGVACVVVGATLYATLYSIQGAFTRNTSLDAVLMIPAAMLSMHFAAVLVFEHDVFCVAPNRSWQTNLLLTALQTSAFWLLFYGAIPWLILRAESEHGVARFDVAFQKPVAVVAFVACTVLAFSSSWSLVRRGDGTPFPGRAARDLVVAGPYRYLRNPMAVGSLLGGVCVGVFLGSWGVILYAVIGAIMWHVAVRPVEETDLRLRFGAPYELYRENVRCWIPRTVPYSAQR